MLEGKIIEYSQKNSIIIDSTIELTNKCNLKCKHCYIENREFYLSKKEVIEIIDILFLEGTMNLTFTGGEIFSHPNFEEIYIYAKKRGFIIELKTNALLTNQEWINLFMDYPPEEINISVYGLSDEEYSSFTGDKSGFKKLINSLDGMYSNCIPFSLHVISTNLNYPDIINGNYKIFFEKYDLEFAFDYDILSSLEGNEFPLNYRLSDDKIVYLENNEHFYFENIEKEYINMKNDKKEFICSGGKTKVFFASNGTVSSCSFDRENSHKFSKENWIFIKKELWY